MVDEKINKEKISDEEIERNMNCPDDCMNCDKECNNCLHGDKYIPIIKFSGSLRQAGNKDRPSYVIPFDKKYIKDKNIDVNKPIKVTVTQ